MLLSPAGNGSSRSCFLIFMSPMPRTQRQARAAQAEAAWVFHAFLPGGRQCGGR